MTDHLANWKEELVACIHFLHARGYAPATSSNYSFRIDPSGPITISSSGIDKGAFQVADLMSVDAQGQAINDSRRPSAETLLHTLIYDRRSDIRCVLHTHSVYNTVLSTLFAERKFLPLAGFEVLKGLEGIGTHETRIEIPIFANSQDMPALAAEIRAYWDEHPDMLGFLLAGHGLYTWGTSIAATKRHVEVFEFLLECTYRIHTFSPTYTNV
ncbi:MAG: methylthioribulose 1-phosphate dehydratase [Bacteroidota bacterium]